MDQKTRCMQFLYKWVTKGHLGNIRKNMVEELEAFVADEQARAQALVSAARMEAEVNKDVPSKQGSGGPYPSGAGGSGGVE